METDIMVETTKEELTKVLASWKSGEKRVKIRDGKSIKTVKIVPLKKVGKVLKTD